MIIIVLSASDVYIMSVQLGQIDWTSLCKKGISSWHFLHLSHITARGYWLLVQRTRNWIFGFVFTGSLTEKITLNKRFFAGL